MIIFSQDGTFFVYLENCKCFRISDKFGETEDNMICGIFADDICLGAVSGLSNAKVVLNKIAFDFKVGNVECNPW